MFCAKCGADLPNDSRFCRSCGQTLGAVSVGGGAAAAVAPARIPAHEPKSSNAILSVVGLVLLFALFGASCYEVYVQWKTSSSLPQSRAERVLRSDYGTEPELAQKGFSAAVASE
jgi:hypothetical protein